MRKEKLKQIQEAGGVIPPGMNGTIDKKGAPSYLYLNNKKNGNPLSEGKNQRVTLEVLKQMNYQDF